MRVLAELAADPGFWSLEHIATLLVVGAAGTGVVAVVLGLLVRGWWTKMGDPVVRNMFLAWYRDPDQQAKREAEIKLVIENQIQRVDGLIRKEIAAQVNTMQQELARTMREVGDEFRTEVKELKEILANQDEMSEGFRTNVTTRLAKIEGALNMFMQGKFTASDSNFPPSTPTFPRRPPK